MQFRPENADKIMKGLKTQTRRIVKPNENLESLATGGVAVIEAERMRVIYQIGRTYAVCPGRGKKAVGRIRITAIRRERLRDIDVNDAVAEGVDYVRNPYMAIHFFQGLWQSLYAGQPGKQWQDNPEVWVLTFELARELHE